MSPQVVEPEVIAPWRSRDRLSARLKRSQQAEAVPFRRSGGAMIALVGLGHNAVCRGVSRAFLFGLLQCFVDATHGFLSRVEDSTFD